MRRTTNDTGDTVDSETHATTDVVTA